MEIINPNAASLTNFEVANALRNVKDTKKKFGLRNLATITYETLQFLESTPCRDQSTEKIVNFLADIKPFNLTRNEILMIINDPPTTPLHIQLLIEDSEERFTEEQSGKVIELCAKSLLPVVETNTDTS